MGFKEHNNGAYVLMHIAFKMAVIIFPPVCVGVIMSKHTHMYIYRLTVSVFDMREVTDS